ncbi:hypothetical protein [Nocardia salmonicida]|uniref:hypothetical protein n=1 Tax=Nocardia salmonicida TaxID=53431 RepID=UPI0007A4D891|nr:hypothetical protein [Nocardia salmonicida]
MTSIIRRAEPIVRPVIEPDPIPEEEGQDERGPAEHEGQEHADAEPAKTDRAAAPGPSLIKVTDDEAAAEAAAAATDDDGPTPLFHIMSALPESGASTLAAWCGCAEEVERDMRWRPPAGHSPYLVLTAPKSPDGVRAARQLAGALSRTVGGGAQVAAIALLEDQPRPTLALRELIAAAERAGIPIHTLAHDPRMRMPYVIEQDRLWTPQTAEKPTVPPVLEHIYRHVFHHIAQKENSR